MTQADSRPRSRLPDAGRLLAQLGRALRGRDEVVRMTAAVFLARGHLLLEDVPGVGKTTLARALADAVGGSTGRVQFTPDLLPSDLTGVTVYQQESGTFKFHPGPLFATIVIGDEINRASPKTQAALLECMQERQVTVDGTSHPLPEPFMVIATQNPVEMEGTYPLPEAQRDRFMAQISIGYPSVESELELLEHGGWQPHSEPSALDPQEANELSDAVAGIYVAPPVRRYALDIVRATRSHDAIQLGASPRAGLQLIALARAIATLAGRDFVVPDDLQEVAGPVLAHRLVLHRNVRNAGTSTQDLLSQLLTTIRVPR